MTTHSSSQEAFEATDFFCKEFWDLWQYTEYEGWKLLCQSRSKRPSLICSLFNSTFDVWSKYWQCIMWMSCFSLPLSSGSFWIQLTPPQSHLFGRIALSPQDCCWKLWPLITRLLLTINASANTLQSPLNLNWLNNKLAFTAVMIHLWGSCPKSSNTLHKGLFKWGVEVLFSEAPRSLTFFFL